MARERWRFEVNQSEPEQEILTNRRTEDGESLEMRLKISILGLGLLLNVSFMVNLAKCYITLSLWGDIQLLPSSSQEEKNLLKNSIKYKILDTLNIMRLGHGLFFPRIVVTRNICGWQWRHYLAAQIWQKAWLPSHESPTSQLGQG